MRVTIFPDLPAVILDFVSYYVYSPDLYIPRRIAHNMVLLVLVGKPIFLRMSNLIMGVYGVILANLDLLVL
jgi:hypothetical protein